MQPTAAGHFKQALAKFHSGDVKGGLLDLEEALRLDSSRWEYHWTRGALNYRRRAYTSAEADVTNAIERCSEVRQAGKIYQRRMFCYGHRERYVSLVQDATWLIDNGFKDGSVYLWRGWSHYKIGEIERAIEDYSRAIELIDDITVMRRNRAILYYKAKQYVEALNDLNVVLTAPIPEGVYLAFVYRLRALILYHLGELEKSRADYNHYRRMADHELFYDVQSYLGQIKRDLDHFFFSDNFPNRPHDKYVLKHLEEYGEV